MGISNADPKETAGFMDILRDHLLGFRVEWRATSHSFSFKVFEITAEFADGTPLFDRKDAMSFPDPVELITEAEQYLNGFIKWDACSHFYMADYFHFCGPKTYKKHCALLEELFRQAPIKMGRGEGGLLEAWMDKKD